MAGICKRVTVIWDVADLTSDAGVQYENDQSVATLEAVYHPFRTSYVALVAAPVVEEALAPCYRREKLLLNSDVLFAFGKADLKPEGLMPERSVPANRRVPAEGWQRRRDWLYRPHRFRCFITRSCPETRARTVADFLVSKGWPPARLPSKAAAKLTRRPAPSGDGVKARAS